MAEIDDMIEFGLEALLSGSDSRRREMVRRMCARWPDSSALSVVFAITSVAAMLEDNLAGSGETTGVGTLAYRIAALLSADIYAVESLSGRPAKAHDLLHFWRRVEPWFFEP